MSTKYMSTRISVCAMELLRELVFSYYENLLKDAYGVRLFNENT